MLITADRLLAGAEEKLSNAEKARRERSRTAVKGIVDIDLSEDGSRVLVSLGDRIFVLDRTTGTSREVLGLLGGRRASRGPPDGEGQPFDPHLSPDGKRVAFVQDGDLWVINDEGDPSRLRSPPFGRTDRQRLTRHPADMEYGVAEFVAQEELGRRRGHWWSPDSRSLVFQRTDARKVDTVYVADPRHPEVAPVPFKFPRAGRPNAIVDLGIVSVDRNAPPRWIAWDLARWPYLAKVEWPKRGPLCLVVLNRAQTELALLSVDPVSGAIRTLLTERDPAWVNLPPGSPAWLEDGSAFLWAKEKTSGWTLELHDATGAHVRSVTEPPFGLREIVGVDENGRAAIVLGATDPREEHVWRVPLDGAKPVALTTGGGVHGAMFEHGTVVISSSLRSGGNSVTALRANGERRELPSVAERPKLVPTTRLASVAAGGRTYHTAITRPRRFDAGRRYPMLLKVYAGPGVKTVVDALDTYLLDQWYADAGFVVVRVDGRGTPDRGRQWERAISKDFITIPLGDQVMVLQALGKRHPELDLERTGIFGWSFGGYVSTMAALLRPDVFRAAIAGAPVMDWQLYDTAYTERYMKMPEENAEGYQHTSALSHAPKLDRPLLIIHGVTDDNVHFAHSLAFIEALYVAGKRAEVVTLSATHMVPDPKLSFAREKVQVDFFREHLGGEG